MAADEPLRPADADRAKVVVEYVNCGEDGPMMVHRLLVNGEPITYLLEQTFIDFHGSNIVRCNVAFLPASVEFVKVEREG